MSTMENVKTCMEKAKGFLLKDGNISPVAIFIMDDEWLPIALNFKDQEEKERCHDLVQKLILLMRPNQVVIISEAWLKEVRGARAIKEATENYVPGKLADDPKRIEVIMVAGGSVDGVEGLIQPFRRLKKGIVFDKPMEGSTGFETAFFGDAWSYLAAEDKEGKVFH